MRSQYSYVQEVKLSAGRKALTRQNATMLAFDAVRRR
jgi:hypothetical protein